MCGLVLIPLIWFYVALTGWPASAIRATVMLTVVIVGWALRRPSDLLNSLFAAALIILLWEPRQLFQAGFQLSFFVVLCIILTLPALRELGQPPDRARPFAARRIASALAANRCVGRRGLSGACRSPPSRRGLAPCRWWPTTSTS